MPGRRAHRRRSTRRERIRNPPAPALQNRLGFLVAGNLVPAQAQLEQDLLTSELEPRESAALDFARKLSRSNPPPAKEDLEPLRQTRASAFQHRDEAQLLVDQTKANLDASKQLAEKAGVPVTAMVAPIIPGLTDCMTRLCPLTVAAAAILISSISAALL